MAGTARGESWSNENSPELSAIKPVSPQCSPLRCSKPRMPQPLRTADPGLDEAIEVYKDDAPRPKLGVTEWDERLRPAPLFDTGAPEDRITSDVEDEAADRFILKVKRFDGSAHSEEVSGSESEDDVPRSPGGLKTESSCESLGGITEPFPRKSFLPLLAAIGTSELRDKRSSQLGSREYDEDVTIGGAQRLKVVPTASVRQLNGQGVLEHPEFKDHRVQGRVHVERELLQAVRHIVHGVLDPGALQQIDERVESALAQENEIGKAKVHAQAAEFLNKASSSKGVYHYEVMKLAALYSERALKGLDDLGLSTGTDVRWVLYWYCLNLATVVGLAPSDEESEKTKQQFEETLDRLTDYNEHHDIPVVEGEAVERFCEGVLEFNLGKRAFCSSGGKWPFLGIGVGKAEPERSSFKSALNKFLTAYRIWSRHYTDVHYRTITATTMVSLCHRVLDRKDAMLSWARREMKVRERLFSKRHFSTMKAIDIYKGLLELETAQPPSPGSDPVDRRELCDGPFREGSSNNLVRLGSQDSRVVDDIVPEEVSIEEMCWTLPLYTKEEGWKSDGWMFGALLSMFEEAQLLDYLAIGAHEFLSFVAKVRVSMWDLCDFHNFSHVFSVTHAAFMLSFRSSAQESLTEPDKLATMLGSLLHDLDHPGVNSDFLIKCANPLADKYPRPTLLEEHHLSLALDLLESSNLLRNLSGDDRKAVLAGIEVGIMGTFMGKHAELVEKLERRALSVTESSDSVASQRSTEGSDPASSSSSEASVDQGAAMKPKPSNPYSVSSEEDRMELIEVLVHCADLSGQAMTKEVALETGKGIMAEFHKQHLMEKAQGMQITAFMASLQSPLGQAKSQLGFLTFVCAPLWSALAGAFPDTCECYQRIERRIVDIDFDHLELWSGVNWEIMSMDSLNLEGSQNWSILGSPVVGRSPQASPRGERSRDSAGRGSSSTGPKATSLSSPKAASSHKVSDKLPRKLCSEI